VGCRDNVRGSFGFAVGHDTDQNLARIRDAIAQAHVDNLAIRDLERLL